MIIMGSSTFKKYIESLHDEIVPKKKYLEEHSTTLVVDWPSRAPKDSESIAIESDSKPMDLIPFLQKNGIREYSTARQLVIARLNRDNNDSKQDCGLQGPTLIANTA